MFGFWLFCLAVQLGFWAILFPRFAVFYKPKPVQPTKQTPVSVIICARNERANLQKNLRIILNQDYPSYEVIVVNDASTDQSEELLSQLKEEYSHLVVVSLEQKRGRGKKGALAAGIHSARHDWLLLTDADCQPCSKNWISGMEASRGAETAMVLGYGPHKAMGNMLSRWVLFETAFVAVQYFSMALWGSPYMGVGRNLMYHKKLFLESQKFDKHKDLASGDDDLFVGAVANVHNTRICVDPKTFMYSEPKESFGALYKQKTRHYSTSTRYRPIHQIILGLLSGSHFGFWILFWILLFISGCNFWLILAFIIREALLLWVWNGALQKLNDWGLLLYVLLFDAFLPLYYLVFAPTLFIKNKSFWK